MKRISLVFAVALGLAVATFVGLWSSNSASAGLSEGLKCYRPLHTVTEQVNRGPLIYISDQFSERNLLVKKPVAFCTPADKSGVSGSAAGASISALVCYETKDAPGQARVQSQRLETDDQFDFNFLVLTKPYALCEPADKLGGTGGGVAGATHPLDDYEFRCYKVRREEHGDRFDPISVRIFDQFTDGGKDVRLGGPSVFCTQVFEKKTKAKNNHIEHAAPVDPPQDFHASTIGATNDRGDPRIFCPQQLAYGHSVWFTYTPGEDVDFEVDTEGSTYDTVLAIFDGYPGKGGEQIACNDDKDYPYSGHSRLNAKLEAYNKYYILVASFGGDAGGKLKVHFDGDAKECSLDVAACAGQSASSVVDLGDVGESAGPAILNLVCYSMSQPAPADVQVRTGDQLTLTHFDLGRGIMYCTPAEKCVIDNQPQVVGNVLPAQSCD